MECVGCSIEYLWDYYELLDDEKFEKWKRELSEHISNCIEGPCFQSYGTFLSGRVRGMSNPEGARVVLDKYFLDVYSK